MPTTPQGLQSFPRHGDQAQKAWRTAVQNRTLRYQVRVISVPILMIAAWNWGVAVGAACVPAEVYIAAFEF